MGKFVVKQGITDNDLERNGFVVCHKGILHHAVKKIDGTHDLFVELHPSDRHYHEIIYNRVGLMGNPVDRKHVDHLLMAGIVEERP